MRKWGSFDHFDNACDSEVDGDSETLAVVNVKESFSESFGGKEEGKCGKVNTEENDEEGVTMSLSIVGEPEEANLNQSYQQMGGLRRIETGAIRTHFYPEGGWGWIVCACAFLAHVTTSGAQLASGALHIVLANKFQDSSVHHWLGPLSWSVSSIFSPLVVNLCRRNNVRIFALIGGILFPLSLFFTSFATELHQIFFSFGLIGGIGSCMVRESSGVVLGEFFRKRRQFVEQVVMAGTGVGVTLFSLLYLSFARHLEWGTGFRLGAAFATICVLLPAFYRTAAKYQPRDRGIGSQGTPKQRVESPKSPSSMVVPIGGDICRSLHLFCVPSLKPLLWSSAISSFGLYTPLFLMSDFLRRDGISGGSLLLLQTHLGLGLSLGVILGAILTLKKFRFCQLSPRVLCTGTACLTGLSMIAISSVEGYYAFSLSAWIYGVALGSHLYTLKVLTMELTRTKHWGRIWSCIQSLMSPGILLGSGLTSYVGKPGFYACATAVLIGAGLMGFQLIDMTKCSSPQLSSSLDNDSPIPPAPPPISLGKYAHQATPLLGVGADTPAAFYPLRRSISLQQPIYPCCTEAGDMGLRGGMGYGYPPGYSPYCRECVLSGSPVPPSWGMFYQPTPTGTMIRSYSLPQTAPLTGSQLNLKSTGTQTNPNSPVRTVDRAVNGSVSVYPGSYDRLPTLPGSFLPQDRVIRDVDMKPKGSTRVQFPTTSSAATAASRTNGTTATTHFRDVAPYKGTVMFASNPQLFPASATQSSASTTDRSVTPSTTHYGQGHNHTHLANGHNHNHRHVHHRNGNGNHHHVNDRDQEDRDSTPSRSPRTYYPQLEERRAQFIRSHQDQTKRYLHPTTTAVVTVETHRKPETKTPPAFTRHYFDSSKIQKGTPISTNIFNTGAIKSVQQPQLHPRQPILSSTTPTTTGNINVSSSRQFVSSQSAQLQLQQQQTIRHPQPTLPISVSAVNAKLQQYQRQQQQRGDQEVVDWRSIQRQSTSMSSNPFENDPDPPYYPAAAALSHAQSHAYNQPRSSAKVSGNEFQDVEQPKFNSLRRTLSRSGQNSSVSSQLNYSITPTPIHQQRVHQTQYPHPSSLYPSSYPQQQQLQQVVRHGNGSSGNGNGKGNNGNVNDNINLSRDDCPYCDPRGLPPPPLSLSVPTLQQSDPHYMCQFGYGPPLRRRNTWHHQKDQLEAITTSV